MNTTKDEIAFFAAATSYEARETLLDTFYVNNGKRGESLLAVSTFYEAREKLRRIYSANNPKEDENLLAGWEEPPHPEGDFLCFCINLHGGEQLEIPRHLIRDFATYLGLPANAIWEEIEAAYEADNDKAREFFSIHKEEITKFLAPLEEWKFQRDYPNRLKAEIAGVDVFTIGEAWACHRRSCDGLRYLVRFVGDYEQHWIEGDTYWRDVTCRREVSDEQLIPMPSTKTPAQRLEALLVLHQGRCALRADSDLAQEARKMEALGLVEIRPQHDSEQKMINVLKIKEL